MASIDAMSTSDQNLRDCRFMLLLPDLTACVPNSRTAQGSGNWRRPATPYRGHTFDPFPPGPSLDSGPTAHGDPGVRAISRTGIVGLIVKL